MTPTKSYLIKKYLGDKGYIIVESWSKEYDLLTDLYFMEILSRKKFSVNWISNLEVSKLLRMLVVNQPSVHVEYIGRIM